MEPLLADSASKLEEAHAGRVVLCGSHGALYPAWLAAKARVKAAVLHDAGIGRNAAGVAGIAWLSGLGLPACAVDHRSARISDARDMLERGVISTANDAAAPYGCVPGMPVREALRCLAKHEGEAPREIPGIGETRHRIRNAGHRAVWALDSITLLRPDDARAVIVSGSHAALLGGREDDGLVAVEVFAAIFNDAGGGRDDAALARLPVLDRRGIAGAAVGCDTARIGDGLSTYETGVITRLNETATRLELRIGMSAREAVARLVGLG